MSVFTRILRPYSSFFFFFNDTATTEIYTLSLHDALPICLRALHLRAGLQRGSHQALRRRRRRLEDRRLRGEWPVDRKSTRLNSSHLVISYAVFCLKKKKNKHIPHQTPTHDD